MNTGHDGSLTTGHANSPRDMLARLDMVIWRNGYPYELFENKLPRPLT